MPSLTLSTTPTSFLSSPSYPPSLHSTTRPQSLQSGVQLHESFASQTFQHAARANPVLSLSPRPYKPLNSHPHNHPLSDSLPSEQVQYFPVDDVPNKETPATIKQAVLRLLDRLARDALQSAMKKDYIKNLNHKDIADARSFWMVDILVGSIDADYNDK